MGSASFSSPAASLQDLCKRTRTHTIKGGDTHRTHTITAEILIRASRRLGCLTDARRERGCCRAHERYRAEAQPWRADNTQWAAMLVKILFASPRTAGPLHIHICDVYTTSHIFRSFIIHLHHLAPPLSLAPQAPHLSCRASTVSHRFRHVPRPRRSDRQDPSLYQPPHRRAR